DARINFHIPIKLRITGDLTDDRLEQLSETLARTLQARLALAERTLRARYDLSTAGIELAAREPYDAGRASEDDDSYLIPSYDKGGQAVSATVKAPRRPWIILKAISFHAYVSP